VQPANSPDLNPVDCRTRGTMQERVYRVPIRNTDEELRQQLSETWAESQHSVVDGAIDQGEKDCPSRRWSV